MTNELIFLAHIGVVCIAILLALRHSYAALIAVISMQLIVANLFVFKQIELAFLTSTCGEIFTVGCMYGVGLIQQRHGEAAAKRAIIYSFLIQLFFLATATMHGFYGLIKSTEMTTAFGLLFSATPRAVLASLAAYVVSERVNLLLVQCALRSGWTHWTVRGITTWIGQAVDTGVFALVGLYGILANLWQVVAVSITIKSVAVLLLMPLLLAVSPTTTGEE